MTKVEIVERAVLLLEKHKHLGLKIIRCVEWPRESGVDLDLQYTKNGGTNFQNFGFISAWFELEKDPLGINRRCGMDKVQDPDEKIVLRIAYYILGWLRGQKY